MSDGIEIEVKELNLLMSRFDKFRTKIARYMSEMSREAGEHVLKQPGLKRYPPATEANQPPTPFYIRGRGMQYKKGNNGKSERYGTQFYVKREGDHARIGNRASYARWLTDENDQAEHMAKIGWRKMIDVANEQLPKIKTIFNKWIQKALKEVGW